MITTAVDRGRKAGHKEAAAQPAMGWPNPTFVFRTNSVSSSARRSFHEFSDVLARVRANDLSDLRFCVAGHNRGVSHGTDTRSNTTQHAPWLPLHRRRHRGDSANFLRTMRESPTHPAHVASMPALPFFTTAGEPDDDDHGGEHRHEAVLVAAARCAHWVAGRERPQHRVRGGRPACRISRRSRRPSLPA